MADKSTAMVLAALSRAVADPHGMPLHGKKDSPGLFASTAGGRLAAQRCKDEGYLQIVRAETKGKSLLEICAITEKGVAYLLAQVSPKQVLEDFIRVLETRRNQTGDLLLTVQQIRASLDALKTTAEKVLSQVRCPQAGCPGPASSNGHHSPAKEDAWIAAVIAFLEQWQGSGASEDCPLPDLFRKAQGASADLTIGRFHDGLRRLAGHEQIYLHPWTGPLYALPEPPYALLVGHEIAYYASIRKNAEN